MDWYSYSRARLVRMIEDHLDAVSNADSFISFTEDYIFRAWDGSQYHCAAHMFSVAATAMEIALKVGLDGDELEAVCVAGLLHDAGRRNVDDGDNIIEANMIAREFMTDYSQIFVPKNYTSYFMAPMFDLVEEGINGTEFPAPGIPETLIGKILRDADFAAVVSPEPVISEIRAALKAEMGLDQSDYSFVIGQGALLPETVEYYKERGLTVPR